MMIENIEIYTDGAVRERKAMQAVTGRDCGNECEGRVVFWKKRKKCRGKMGEVWV